MGWIFVGTRFRLSYLSFGVTAGINHGQFLQVPASLTSSAVLRPHTFLTTRFVLKLVDFEKYFRQVGQVGTDKRNSSGIHQK